MTIWKCKDGTYDDCGAASFCWPDGLGIRKKCSHLIDGNKCYIRGNLQCDAVKCRIVPEDKAMKIQNWIGIMVEQAYNGNAARVAELGNQIRQSLEKAE